MAHIHVSDIVEENENILKYLISRNILEQYKKCKTMLLWWYTQKYDFKIRQPKNHWIYSFRINLKYRAFWKMLEIWGKNTLVVYEISDHQDF